MKNIFLVSIFALAIPAFSLPERADVLISSSMSAVTPLLERISSHPEGLQYHPNFYSIKISRLKATKELRSFCKQYSRSASFLELLTDPDTAPTAYYFSTSSQGKDMKLCVPQPLH